MATLLWIRLPQKSCTCSKKNMALSRTGSTEFTVQSPRVCNACLASENPANRTSYAGSSRCLSSQAFNCREHQNKITYTEFFSSWTFTSVLLLRYLDNSIGCCSPLRVLFSQSLHGKYGQSWQQWGRLNLSKEDLRTRLGNHIWNPQLCWDCTWNMSQRMTLLFLLLRTKKRCDRGLCEVRKYIYESI